MKRTKFGKVSVALAAVITLIGVFAYGFTKTHVDTSSVGYLYDAPAEVVFQEVGPNRWAGNPLAGSWRFVDFIKDSDVINDNDTDSGQSPLEYDDWLYTVTNTTSPTVVTHAENGTLVVTNATADNDCIEADEKAEWVKFTAGNAYYFCFKGKYDCTTSSQADFGVGLGIQDTDWLGDSAIMSDGVFFEINDGDLKLDLVTAYNASSTSDYVRQADLARVVDNTTFKLEFIVLMDMTTSGTGRIIARKDGVVVYDGYSTAIVYDEELCIKWALQNGAGEGQAITIDYIGAGADRDR